jgi:hypothetical protein
MLQAPVSEWIRYTDFLRDEGLLTLKANFVGKLEAAISTWVQDYHERRVKRLLARTGLYEYELINIRHYMNHTTHYLPLDLTGEPGLSSGAALAHLVDKYCGTINVGPFGCMNSRMTESVATIEMTVDGKQKAARNAGLTTDYSYLKESTDALPFLSLELDGNPFSQIEEARFETFLLQANRLHQRMMERRDGDGEGRLGGSNGIGHRRVTAVRSAAAVGRAAGGNGNGNGNGKQAAGAPERKKDPARR